MRVTPTLSWQLATDPAEPLDPRLAPLLRAIAATGSLAAAVGERGLSYRAGWGLLREQQRKLGVRLVVLERGRGAHLAPAGDKLIGAQRTAEERLAKLLPGLAVELKSPIGAVRRRPMVGLSVAASHDLALTALRDALPAAAGLVIDVAFVGSLQALEQFAAGRVEMGGFHVAADVRNAADLAPFRRLLHAHRDRLIKVVDRDQGFILPRGNRARVQSFADVARKRLRFVNRQRGSGTRVLIDRLLADEGIEPGLLVGYANEEFTHHAVAATVASGAADVGFGLRAAAAAHGLAFVPRVREHYYLAVRAKALATAEVARLLEALRGAALAGIVARLPGYQLARAGTVLAIEALGS